VAMLSSRPVQLTTDAPYSMTKTPGRALANRGENVHAGALSVNPKGKNANGMPRTPFQPASTVRQKVVKDQKHGTTTTRLHLTDKTPLPNRIGAILFQTPLPPKQSYLKSSKLVFADPDALTQPNGNSTPDSAQRPSSTRKHVKHPRSATQNFETPMNQGNHWDISDDDIVLPADMQPALQDMVVESDDFDEIESMAPNTLDLPYEPPLDFELPDYKVLGKNLRNLAYSCPYDDSPSPPEPEIVVSDIAISTWDMFKLPPLSLEDDPFHQARAELAQASGKTPIPISKTRVVTKTRLQPSGLARQSSNHTNPVLLSKATRNISQPQRTMPVGNIRSSRPGTSTSVGTTTTGGTVVKSKSTTSKVIKPVPSVDLKGGVSATARTAVTKNALVGPAKSAYHKSAVSLSSRPAGVAATTRVAATNTVRRPHTVLDMNKKRDKPAGVQGALMLVGDLHANGDVMGEDFLFDV